jgi:hypothetical protein
MGRTNPRIVVSAAVILTLMSLPLGLADAGVSRKVVAIHPEGYYNSVAGTNVSSLGFFALVSHANRSITWWEGGVEFVYTPGSPEYDAKVDALKKGVLYTLELVGFAFPYGTIRMTDIELTVVFSGVAKYDRYLFADSRSGVIHVKWSQNAPLVITARVMVTAIADDVGQYLYSEWTVENISEHVRRAVPPAAYFNAEKNSEYAILVIPIDGEERAAPEITDSMGRPIPYTYFGIGPVAKRVAVTDGEAGFEIRVNPLYFDRLPLYRVVDDTVFYKYNSFYGYAYPVPSVP